MRRPFAVLLLALLALVVLPGQGLPPPYGTPNYQTVYVNGVPVVTGVADTLTLRLTPISAAANGLWRLSDGVAGAKPLFMKPGVGPCPTDDGAICVNSSTLDGNHWNGQFPRNEVDPAMFSAVSDTTGNVDSTPQLKAADSSAAGLSLTLMCSPGTEYTVDKWYFTNFAGIKGCNFQILASGGANDYLVYYGGPGGVTFEDDTFTAPIYNPATQAQPATGYNELLIEPGTTGGAIIPNVRVIHTKFVGGAVQFQAAARDLYVNDMVNDRPWAFGWVVTPVDDVLATGGTQHIRIRDTRGYAPGYYCGSYANQNTGVVNLTPRDLDIRGVHCEGAGWIAQKSCFDFTGTGIEQGYFEGDGYNCFNGGIEVKKTVNNTNTIPNVFGDFQINYRYYTNVDAGIGCFFPYSNPSTLPDQYTRITATCETKFGFAGAWQPNAFYHVGDTVVNSGNTYIAQTPGKSAASGGPTGTGTGIVDGATQWLYVQATPANSSALNALTGCEVESITDMDYNCIADGAAYGYELMPRGSSDQTLRRINLRFSGTVAQSCIYLNNTVFGTIDKLRLVNWTCRSGGSPIYFPYADTLTNFEIVGGSFVNDPAAVGGTCATGTYGAFRNDAATVTGTITGAPRFVGCTAAFYMGGGTTNLTWSGGGSAEVSYTSGGPPIWFAGTSLGNITVTTPIYVTSAVAITSPNWPAWKNGSSGTPAPTVYGRFNRYFSATAPVNTTDLCVAGDRVLAITPAAGVPNGWFCSAANTWTAF